MRADKISTEVKVSQFYVQRNGSRTAGPFKTREAARQHSEHMSRVSISLDRFRDKWRVKEEVTLVTREITQEEIDKLKRAALRQEKLRAEIEKSRKQIANARQRAR